MTHSIANSGTFYHNHSASQISESSIKEIQGNANFLKECGTRLHLLEDHPTQTAKANVDPNCLALHATTPRQPETELRLKRASHLLTELKSVIAEGVELGEIDPRCLAQIEKFQITARQPLRKSSSGWLRHHTRKKQRQDGTWYEVPVRTYRGDPHSHPEDWYWNYQWREEGKVRSIYVAREKLSQVKSAIASNQTPSEIIKLIKGGTK